MGYKFIGPSQPIKVYAKWLAGFTYNWTVFLLNFKRTEKWNKQICLVIQTMRYMIEAKMTQRIWYWYQYWIWFKQVMWLLWLNTFINKMAVDNLYTRQEIRYSNHSSKCCRQKFSIFWSRCLLGFSLLFTHWFVWAPIFWPNYKKYVKK